MHLISRKNKSLFSFAGTILLAVCCALSASSQNIGINTSGAPPDASAVLDVDAGNKGLLLPRLTAAQRDAIASPAAGLFIYDITGNKLEYWNGAAWIQIADSAIPAANGAGINAGRSVAISATGNAADHSAVLDVQSTTGGLLFPRLSANQRNAITSPIAGLLVYNSTSTLPDIYTGSGWVELCGTPVSSVTGAVNTPQNVGINTASPDPSAMLDVSSSTAGLAIPRLTSTQRDAILSPAQGLILFNTTTQTINLYDGSGNWLNFVSPTPPSAPVAGVNTFSTSQIEWNWNAVNGAAGYKYNTSNNYSTATDIGTDTTYEQTGISCNSNYTLYVWAYNCAGNSPVATLTQSTAGAGASPKPCGWNNSFSFTDPRDNTVYAQVQLGNQCWMAQNLNYGTYVTVATTQAAPGTQKYCYADNTANCSTYGGLYEWLEMMNGSSTCDGVCTSANGNCDSTVDHQACATPVQGVCPVGWHIPSQYEWVEMERAISCNPSAFPYDETTNNWLGTQEAIQLKVVSAGGNNSSMFSAQLGGYTEYGASQTLGQNGWWWSSTLDPSNPSYGAWARGVSDFTNMILTQPTARIEGMSVRCIKD